MGSLILPALVLGPLGAPTAASLIGLGGLGVALLTVVAGWRIALYSSAALGLLSGLAVAAAGNTWAGVVVMVLVAVGQGLSARIGLQQMITTLSITVAFVTAEDPTQSPVASGLTFAIAMGGYAALVTLIAHVVGRSDSHSTQGKAHDPSWPRTWGYTVSLALATVATSVVALLWQWGHTGGWLIMTPFIVMLPYVQGSVRKALSRGAGTIGGFAIAMVAYEVLGSGWLITSVGIAFGVLAATAVFRKWPYAIYALWLTPAIVILESIGRNVEVTAQERLGATVLGVGIALVFSFAAYGVGRFLVHVKRPITP